MRRPGIPAHFFLRFLLWPLVWAFNLVGLVDLVLDTAGALRIDLPSMAAQLGAGYAIFILDVPALFLTHLLALWLLLRPARFRFGRPARRCRWPRLNSQERDASGGYVIGGANRFHNSRVRRLASR